MFKQNNVLFKTKQATLNYSTTLHFQKKITDKTKLVNNNFRSNIFTKLLIAIRSCIKTNNSIALVGSQNTIILQKLVVTNQNSVNFGGLSLNNFLKHSWKPSGNWLLKIYQTDDLFNLSFITKHKSFSDIVLNSLGLCILVNSNDRQMKFISKDLNVRNVPVAALLFKNVAWINSISYPLLLNTKNHSQYVIYFLDIIKNVIDLHTSLFKYFNKKKFNISQSSLFFSSTNNIMVLNEKRKFWSKRRKLSKR